MKNILLAVAVLALSACTSGKSQLICTKNGETVFDSGVLDGSYSVAKLERSDAYRIGYGTTYQPEPGSVCRADYWGD